MYADCLIGFSATVLLKSIKASHFFASIPWLFSSALLYFHPRCVITNQFLTPFTMFNFSWFKASNKEDQNTSTWNPNTLTMEQPSSPSAPVAQQNQGVVTEQPVRE